MLEGGGLGEKKTQTIHTVPGSLHYHPRDERFMAARYEEGCY